MSRKRMTTVYLEPQQIERLRRIHAKLGVPMSELIREGVETMLLAREHPQRPEERLAQCLGMVKGRQLDRDLVRLVEAATDTRHSARVLRQRLHQTEDRLRAYQGELLRMKSAIAGLK